MLLVDYREGSKELIAPLKKMGLPVEQSDLDAGDVAFVGRGERGASVTIGVEFKKLGELMQSLRTGRLQGHQLGKMQEQFEFMYLLIEGELRFDDRGKVLKRIGRKDYRPYPGGMLVGELLKRLNVLHLRWGIVPIWCEARRASVMQIAMLYRTWTDTDLDKHKSHLAVYRPPPVLPISPKRQALCAWPGIQVKVSKAALDRFKTLRGAANADIDEWADLAIVDEAGKSRRLGTSVARRIVEFVST